MSYLRMNKNDPRIPMVVIPKGMLFKFHGEKPHNHKNMSWAADDSMLFEEKKVEFSANTLESLCANLYLVLEAVITKTGATENTGGFMSTARRQLKSFGIDVAAAVEECYATPTDDELWQLHMHFCKQ